MTDRIPLRTPPCAICGDERETQAAHFPKPYRKGGRDTILLCPLHHRVVDHGRARRSEMEALMKNAFPNFSGSAEEFVRWAHEAGYPYSLEGRSRNMRLKFWDQ